jgi:hypothetical protein
VYFVKSTSELRIIPSIIYMYIEYRSTGTAVLLLVCEYLLDTRTVLVASSCLARSTVGSYYSCTVVLLR